MVRATQILNFIKFRFLGEQLKKNGLYKVRFLIMRTACAQIRAFHAHHTSRATNFNSKLEFARSRFAFFSLTPQTYSESRGTGSISKIDIGIKVICT
eukprot:sb/3479033/